MTDSTTYGREMAAALAARGEQIKTKSAEFLSVCLGVKPPLPPPDKPVVIDRSSPPGREAFEAAMRKDAMQLQLRQRIRPK